MKILFYCIICICLFTACEKELKLNLPAGQSQLVVEGYIENNNYPYVLLTNSVGFFDTINLTKIKFEKNAVVTVTDINTNYTATLLKYTFAIPNIADSGCFYYIPPIAQYDSIKGQINHQYKLNILVNGKTHEAITKVVNQNAPDSIWLNKIPNDSAYFVNVLYKDPDTLGNYTRYETQVKRQIKQTYLSENYLTSFSSVFDDVLTNGQKLPYLIDLGFDKSLNFKDTASANKIKMQTKIYKGDTVTLKFSGIDYKTYNFWNTLEFSRNSTGNPFAAPTKVQGNVSDAIGIWGGYGSKFISIIAPK